MKHLQKSVPDEATFKKDSFSLFSFSLKQSLGSERKRTSRLDFLFWSEESGASKWFTRLIGKVLKHNADKSDKNIFPDTFSYGKKGSYHYDPLLLILCSS